MLQKDISRVLFLREVKIHPDSTERRDSARRITRRRPNKQTLEEIKMSNKNSNKINVPEARQAMNNMKQEVANELGITLNNGYNGNLSSRDAGYIGGNMVKKMIEAQEKQMSNK